MNELIRTLLLVALGAGALIVVLAALVALVARSRHGSLRQGVDAFFRSSGKCRSENWAWSDFLNGFIWR